jgi:hypothetical protein
MQAWYTVSEIGAILTCPNLCSGPKCTCTVTRLGTSNITGMPELAELLSRNATAMDLWSSYALTLSIDG